MTIQSPENTNGGDGEINLQQALTFIREGARQLSPAFIKEMFQASDDETLKKMADELNSSDS